MKSALRLVRDVEHVGGTMSVSYSRSIIAVHVTALRSSASDRITLPVLAETLQAVTQPLLLEYEVELVRDIVLNDIESDAQNVSLQLKDALHFEAFGDAGLSQAPTSPFLA